MRRSRYRRHRWRRETDPVTQGITIMACVAALMGLTLVGCPPAGAAITPPLPVLKPVEGCATPTELASDLFAAGYAPGGYRQIFANVPSEVSPNVHLGTVQHWLGGSTRIAVVMLIGTGDWACIVADGDDAVVRNRQR